MPGIDPRPSLFDNEDDLLRNLPCVDVVYDFKYRMLPYIEFIQFDMKKLVRSGQFDREGEYITSVLENCTKLSAMLDSYLSRAEAGAFNGINCKSILGMLEHDLIRWMNLIVGYLDFIHQDYTLDVNRSPELDDIFTDLWSATNHVSGLFWPPSSPHHIFEWSK